MTTPARRSASSTACDIAMTERRHELRRYPWQVRDSGQLLLVVAAGVWLVVSVAQTAADGLQDPRIAISFGALIAFGEVLRLNLPGDRESAPIGFAGALAYALLIRVGTHVVALQRPAGGDGRHYRHDHRRAAAPGRRPARPGERHGRAPALRRVRRLHFPPAGGSRRRRPALGPGLFTDDLPGRARPAARGGAHRPAAGGRAAGQVPGGAGGRDARSVAAGRGGGRFCAAHRVCGRGDGVGRAGRVHGAVARHPGCVPPVRRDPGHLPADRARAGQGDRDRRVRGSRSFRTGRHAGRGDRPGARHPRACSCSSSSTPRSCTTSASCRCTTRFPAGPLSWSPARTSSASPSSAPT